MKNPYKGSYDELCAKVNESYKRTNDVRETVKETGIDFDVVWEMLGFKDYFDFYPSIINQPRYTFFYLRRFLST